MEAPDTGDEWLSLTDAALPIGDAYDWVVRDGCGAVVLFSGTTRDHAEGRDGVTSLTYEAYAEEIDDTFAEIVGEIRRRWPTTGRVVMWHRVGISSRQMPSRA